MTQILTQTDIKDAIIHRYENLLIDSVEHSGGDDMSGTLHLTITDNDPLGRDIFFKTLGEDSQLLSTLHMEILALGAIAGTGTVKEGYMVLFTGISNFEYVHPLTLNTPLKGTFKKLSDKAGFLRYSGETYAGDTLLAKGEMMAFLTPMSTESSPSKQYDIPEQNRQSTVALHEDYIPKSMTLADRLYHLSDTECVTTYTYPPTHPFTKGHFPGNPIMMGVMQWLSVEDACRSYYSEHNLTGDKSISFSAMILRPDGSLVTEIRRCTVTCSQYGEFIDTNIVSTKKVSFRNMVKPGEELFIYLRDISVS